MNKTITIYELLGMIKDGKAPKKIKWENRIYNLESDRVYYCDETENIMEMDFLFEDLEDEVKILDEEDEFIEIGKIVNQFTNFKSNEAKFKILVDLINDLVHNQKILIEKMKEMK